MQKLNHSLKLVCIAENRLCRQSINGRRNSARINAVTLGGLHIPRTADLENYTVIYVHIAVLLFRVTVQKANIVPLSALPMQGEQNMTKELYDKVVAYRISMSVIKSMLKSNIITAQEYSEIDTIIARENGLSSCNIFGEMSG